MSDLIRQSVEQMRANAIKRTEEKLEQQKRYEHFQEQENRRINQQQQFAKHIDKIQKQEDKIVKNVLSIDQSYDEFNRMMSTYNMYLDDNLKEKMRSVLATNSTSAYHVRLMTDFVQYLLHQHQHILTTQNKKKSSVKVF